MSTATITSTRKEFKLKPISKEGIDAAINKAEHYRLLNQPRLAESICLDVLEVDPKNQKTNIILLLALTDQFGQSHPSAPMNAQMIADALQDEYSRLYYTGIIRERQGNVALASSVPGSDFDAYEWYTEAMELYEKAAAVNKDPKNDDTSLRWNTCARIIMNGNLKERPRDEEGPILE
jgi:tetratricopeptide (TPR) repeat protein